MNSVLKLIDQNLIQIGTYFFTIIALIGNSLVFYILTRLKFLKETIFRYFIASQTVATLIFMLVWVHTLRVVFSWNVAEYYCKIYVYFLSVAYCFYPWISVLNSIDRLLSVKYRSKFKFRKEIKYQLLALGIVLTSIMFTNIPYLFYEVPSETKCIINNNTIGFYISLETLAISCFIPFIVKLFITTITIHYLLANKIKLQHKIRDENFFIREKRFAKSVLTMDLWHFICYSPYCLFCFLRYALDKNIVKSFEWKLSYDSTIVLALADVCCNFFILLSSSKSQIK